MQLVEHPHQLAWIGRTLWLESIEALLNLPTVHLRHTRVAQDCIEEGHMEGRLEGEAFGCAAEASSEDSIKMLTDAA